MRSRDFGAGVLLFGLAVAGPAAAQKVPGTTLSPMAPALTPAAPSVPAPLPAPRPARPGLAPAAQPAPVAGGAERDAEARQLAGQLPLDPATANLQGRLPADVPGTTRRLGLRVPSGTASDLRNRPTTREAVIDALRH